MASTLPNSRRFSYLIPCKRLLLCALLLGGNVHAASAQEARLAEPQPATALTLEECIRIGLEKQPAIAAQLASVAAAESSRRAVDRLLLVGLISPEIPIRRKQADLGVTIASAGLTQAEWETTYAISRNYFSALYARSQQAVLRDVIDSLVRSEKVARALVEKKDPDIQVTLIDVNKIAATIDLYKLRLIEATEGVERALAALREGMGLPPGCPVAIVEGPLPPPEPGLDHAQLLQAALSRRGEIAQVHCAAQVTELEVEAQGTSFMLTMRTFAAVSDVHSRPIPQGISNHFYRPGAIGLEMPTTLAGKRGDRVRRARDLHTRMLSVVAKTHNLIALELDDAYLRWREAAAKIRTLQQTPKVVGEVVNGIMKRLEIGKASGEDVIRALTMQDQTQAQLNEALYHHALALAALERITAGGYVPHYRRR